MLRLTQVALDWWKFLRYLKTMLGIISDRARSLCSFETAVGKALKPFVPWAVATLL